MIYIRPLEQGYSAFNLWEKLQFEDKDHQHLFSFVEADIVDVPKLFSEYFRSRIDSHSLELKTGEIAEQESLQLANAIKKRMDDIHPFLSTNNYASVFPMLANHLNYILINKDAKLAKEDYACMLSHLVKPLITLGIEPLPPILVPTSGEFVSAYFSKYLDQNKKVYSESGIKYINNVQALAKRYLYWILDASSTRFGNLPIDDRSKLYSQIFRVRQLGSDMKLLQSFYWSEPHTYDYAGNNSEMRLLELFTQGVDPDEAVIQIQQEEQQRKEEYEAQKENSQIFAELLDDTIALDSELADYLKTEIEKACDSKDAALFVQYEVQNFEQLIQLEVWLMINETAIVKRCRHCGHYFLTDKMSVDYCSRIAEGETQTCVVIGPKHTFSKLLTEDAALKAYNRTYKTFYARLRRGTVSEDKFSAWKTEARSRLEETRQGASSFEEYEAWLKRDIRKWTAN